MEPAAKSRAVGLLTVGLFSGAFLSSCATHNTATRSKIPDQPASTTARGAKLDPAFSCYIESDHGPEYSCSFVEFDERGDFLEFKQHQHCWGSIKELADNDRILLVMSCHGWKNSAQSGDVVEFNGFLGRLARSKPVRDAGLRVHGVYLGWKGGWFRGAPSEDKFQDHAGEFFDENITDSSRQNHATALTVVPDQLSYWNRKRAAEDRVSAVPLSRAVFTYASVADSVKSSPRAKDNIVVLIGHSFGALMVEQSVAEASVGAIVTQWPWFSGKTRPITEYFPIDLVLLINSAAPSLYSKMLRDLADTHDSATDDQSPLFVSITSKGDAATKALHPIANLASPLDRSMQNRSYVHQVFSESADRAPDETIRRDNRGDPILKRAEADPPVPQHEFYSMTPGHNKFLVSHRIVPDQDFLRERSTKSWDEIFAENLTSRSAELDFKTYGASGRQPGEKRRDGWKIERLGEEIPHGGRNYAPLKSAYWIIQCEEDIIGSHNDIWNERAMHAYGAIFGLSRALR